MNNLIEKEKKVTSSTEKLLFIIQILFSVPIFLYFPESYSDSNSSGFGPIFMIPFIFIALFAIIFSLTLSVHFLWRLKSRQFLLGETGWPMFVISIFILIMSLLFLLNLNNYIYNRKPAVYTVDPLHSPINKQYDNTPKPKTIR